MGGTSGTSTGQTGARPAWGASSSMSYSPSSYSPSAMSYGMPAQTGYAMRNFAPPMQMQSFGGMGYGISPFGGAGSFNPFMAAAPMPAMARMPAASPTAPASATPATGAPAAPAPATAPATAPAPPTTPAFNPTAEQRTARQAVWRDLGVDPRGSMNLFDALRTQGQASQLGNANYQTALNEMRGRFGDQRIDNLVSLIQQRG